ncbi:MAG: NAD(P)/FAD-dependent oxidoreductase [Bacillota bacterium]
MSKLLKKIENELKKSVSESIHCREWRSSIVIEGEVDSWDKVIEAGKTAAKRGYKGVVNRVVVKGLELPGIKSPSINDFSLQDKRVDVLIIGGGIIGCSIARELSKWNISVLLAEKEDDLAMHASSRNDGMVHPGIEPKPGTKKAYFNVKGNDMYTRVADELDIPLRRSGSLVVYDNYWLKFIYPLFERRAKQNGVKGIRHLSRAEVKSREPHIADNIVGGLLFPSTAVLSPYKLTIAYGENAMMNGVEVSLNTVVQSMTLEGNRISTVKTNRGTIYPKVVINAAGVYSDKIADMANDQFFTIHPRKGQVILVDNKRGGLVTSVIGKPSFINVKGVTKGGGIVKTIEDNILVGPDAYEQPYREDYSTNRENIQNIIKKHFPIIPALSPADIITYFAGIRASTYEEDFVIEKSEYVRNLIHSAGIQSPGLASAPAIAEEVERLTCEVLKEFSEVKPKEGWNPIRKGIPELHKMSAEERNQYIKARPDYGVIICRCEEISKGEIIDAIRSPIPCHTVDGIKRRVRAGLGRCQGGFCLPHVLKLIQSESGVKMTEVTKKGNASYILTGETKAGSDMQEVAK